MQLLSPIIGLLTLLIACGGNGSFNNGNQTGAGNATPKKPPTPAPPKPNTPDPRPNLPEDDVSPGELFFTSAFKPFVKETCKPCHSEGGAGKIGSIVTYATARALLTTPSGATASTNNLYKTMRTNPPHATDPCGGDETKGACKQVKDWWAAEFPPTTVPPATPPGGETASKTFFTDTVKPKMASCLNAGCHGSGSAKPLDTYELAKAQLAMKPAGGGPTNNALINKPALTNGVTQHGGGKQCDQITASPCKEFQDWYKMEFP